MGRERGKEWQRENGGSGKPGHRERERSLGNGVGGSFSQRQREMHGGIYQVLRGTPQNTYRYLHTCML